LLGRPSGPSNGPPTSSGPLDHKLSLLDRLFAPTPRPWRASGRDKCPGIPRLESEMRPQFPGTPYPKSGLHSPPARVAPRDFARVARRLPLRAGHRPPLLTTAPPPHRPTAPPTESLRTERSAVRQSPPNTANALRPRLPNSTPTASSGPPPSAKRSTPDREQRSNCDALGTRTAGGGELLDGASSRPCTTAHSGKPATPREAGSETVARSRPLAPAQPGREGRSGGPPRRERAVRCWVPASRRWARG
jgi:hypothetical protein